MKTRAIALLFVLLIPTMGFAQSVYLQDFESLAQTDGTLAGDGWLVFGNIFDPGGIYLWGHGPWPAPNNIGNWCDIVDGEGGAAQDMQQLVVYSDYGNGDHAVGNLIESNLFQEQVVPVGATGTWTFTFDAKMGNLGGSSTALAFIKTLDPNAGWATTNFITVDMTNTAATWTDYMLEIDVAGMDGQILQFGFSSTAANYEPCGVFYDNVAFSPNGVVATDEISLDGLKSLYR
jgi:hypothetical protein